MVKIYTVDTSFFFSINFDFVEYFDRHRHGLVVLRRHNSVALDLCVFAEEEGVYTLMGPELDEEG